MTVVLHLANAFSFVPPEAFIRGLAAVKQKTGKDVHFVHVSHAIAHKSTPFAQEQGRHQVPKYFLATPVSNSD